MNLRFKTLLTTSVSTVVLVVGLSAGLSYLVLQQISLIEAHTMSRRLDKTIKSLIDDLGISAGADHSPLSDPRHPLEQTNFNLDLAIALDRNGNPRHQPDSLVRGAQLPSPALQAILANLPAEWASLPTTEPLDLATGFQVGFLQTTEGLLLLAERPLLPGKGDNPEALRLLTGQWLRSDRLQKLGDRTLLRLSLLSVADPDIPLPLRDPQLGNLRAIADYLPTKDFQWEIPPDNASGNSPSIDVDRAVPKGGLPPLPFLPAAGDGSNRPVPAVPGRKYLPKTETKFLAGYALLRDVKGQPVAVLQAISPKPFLTYGEEGVKILLVFLWVMVLIFGIVHNLLLDRWVLSRISSLSHQLKLVKADFSHSTPVALRGQDELSSLAVDINRMLQQQECYQESLRLAKANIEAANQELARLASTDGLTQIMNRRFFQIQLEEAWQNGLQTAQPLSLLLCDVDFFKLYNDTYGHLAGDLCLQKVAQALTTALEDQPTAILARYGGEEFAAVLVDTPVNQAIAVAEKMRRSVLSLNLPHSDSKAADCVTLSIGICSLIPQPHLSGRDLIARADECLYQAKAEGRNRSTAVLPAIAPAPADVQML
jgi:diguanylate cyclase (GGDEF)-like protein